MTAAERAFLQKLVVAGDDADQSALWAAAGLKGSLAAFLRRDDVAMFRDLYARRYAIARRKRERDTMADALTDGELKDLARTEVVEELLEALRAFGVQARAGDLKAGRALHDIARALYPYAIGAGQGAGMSDTEARKLWASLAKQGLPDKGAVPGKEGVA